MNPLQCSLVLSVALAAPLAQAGITDIALLEGVRVWEQTATLEAITFAPTDARLLQVLSGTALTQASRDFGWFDGQEDYDIYLSDATGQVDAHGSYVTIDGTCGVPWNCFNINEVALVVDGHVNFATGIVRTVYGRDGSHWAGDASAAADGNLATYSVLGDTIGLGPDARMSMTLSFANVPVTPPVPEPGAWALLLGGLAVVGRKARAARAAV